MIDRTWWNNLVDDDGSGQVGTIWNKAAIKGLLDAIDAMFKDGTPWSPTILGASGTPIYSAQNGIYSKSGKNVIVAGNVTISSKGSLSGTITIGGLPYAIASYGAGSIGYFAGLVTGSNFTGMGLYYRVAEQVLRPTVTILNSPVGLLDASHIGGTGLDLYFTAAYTTY